MEKARGVFPISGTQTASLIHTAPMLPWGPSAFPPPPPCIFPAMLQSTSSLQTLRTFTSGQEILSSHPPPCSRIQFPYTPPATPRPRPIAGRLEGQGLLPAEAALFVDNVRENSFLS